MSNMQIASRALRRSYATHSRAREGRALSAPKAVRERRAAQKLDKDTNKELSQSELAAYQRALALGDLAGKGKEGGEPTEVEWLAKLNQRRNRIRGIKIEKQKDGQTKVVAMGQKVYLPNIIFRMVRNHTPRGMPYNPYQATFRLPQSVTKTDIRSYLLSVYGVETTYIRTDNYLSPLHRSPINGSSTVTKSYKTYKRAVVGLVKPFEPPPAYEALESEEFRRQRRKYLEDNFAIQSAKTAQRLAYLRMTKKGSEKWTWRNITMSNRGQILRAIGHARWKREHALEATEELMQEARASGLPVDQLDGDQLKKRIDMRMDDLQYRKDLKRKFNTHSS
jgi:large subunit ribosomal protein L23